MKIQMSWFEIPVADLNRAKKFYSAILNCELSDYAIPNNPIKYARFPMEQGGSTGGALAKGDGYEPSSKGSVLWFNVEEELTKVLSNAEKTGGKVLMPKTSAGQYGFVAHVLDSEGNKLVLHSSK